MAAVFLGGNRKFFFGGGEFPHPKNMPGINTGVASVPKGRICLSRLTEGVVVGAVFEDEVVNDHDGQLFAARVELDCILLRVKPLVHDHRRVVANCIPVMGRSQIESLTQISNLPRN